jgi:hypothetical protein
MALRIGQEADRTMATRRMFVSLERADWLVKIDIENCLVSHFEELKEQIETEIVQRQAQLPQEYLARDPVLSVLRRIKRHKTG